MKGIPALILMSSLIASPLAAESSYSNEAVGTAEVKQSVHQITETHMVIETRSTYTSFATTDTNNPLNGSSGPCFGVIEINGTAMNGGGTCLFTDQGGDIATISWHTDQMGEGGAPIGTWRLTGGSGKYVGASGGGAYSIKPDDDPATSTNMIQGEITLK